MDLLVVHPNVIDIAPDFTESTGDVFSITHGDLDFASALEQALEELEVIGIQSNVCNLILVDVLVLPEVLCFVVQAGTNDIRVFLAVRGIQVNDCCQLKEREQADGGVAMLGAARRCLGCGDSPM